MKQIPKKITVFAGHYGSGKSNLAVNYALALRKTGREVALCDLDIVNPYFRSKDSEDILTRLGIRVIASAYANTNLDVPAIPPEAYAMFSAGEHYSVVDLGGDDRGAYALGRFADFLVEPQGYDMLLVLNRYRPDTATVELALAAAREIEDACHVRFTGVVNNSNLGPITQAAHVLDTVSYANAVAEALELPLVMTSYSETLGTLEVPEPFPITITNKEIWNIEGGDYHGKGNHS